MMVDWQAPLYLGGMIAYIVADAIVICLLIIARISMARSNSKRLANPVDAGPDKIQQDITDREDPNFIYRL